ncbi:uncharacterized protein [Lepeophtheirus salmonis]|nr:uncharacterized protein LOC121129939 isoform X2 [Lepeophtheirus salmonis]
MSSVLNLSHDESTCDTESSTKDCERKVSSSPSLGNGLKMRITRNGKIKPGSTSSSSSSANNSRAASPSSSCNSRTDSDGKNDLVHDFILAATGAGKDQENPLQNLILKQQNLKENSGGSNDDNSREGSIFNGDEDERSNEASTMTEPDKLGPCEPGTAVRLQGIVWQETEKGLLVLNVTWKGKTYMGTLLDCNRQSEAHKWGPLIDPSSIKGRGSKRNRGGRSRTPPVSGNGNSKLSKKNGKNVPPPKTLEPNPTANVPSKVKRKAAINALCGLKKTEPDEDDDSVDEYDDDENDCRDCLIECPKSNCSKKFRDLEALKFHLSFAHNDLKRPKKPMESQIVPDEDSNLEECEMTPAEEIESKSCSNVEMPENVPKKLENGSQKTLPPMPLNTLPRQARLTSSTGSSSNKDSCESNAYSDISDEEPETFNSGISDKGLPTNVTPSVSHNSQRTSTVIPNVTSVPTSTNNGNILPPNTGSNENINLISSVSHSPMLQPSTSHFSSPSNSAHKGNLLAPGLPSTPPNQGSPFASQAFRHFAMFGSAHSPQAKPHQPFVDKHLSESHIFNNHHSRRMLHQMDPKLPAEMVHPVNRTFSMPLNAMNKVNSAVDFSHGSNPNQFLAASKLQELQEKAFSSLHPDMSAPSAIQNSPSNFTMMDPAKLGNPGVMMNKGPLHNLFPRGPPFMHSPNILRHEHKHTHLHLPGISPLSNSKNEPMDTNHYSGNN